MSEILRSKSTYIRGSLEATYKGGDSANDVAIAVSNVAFNRSEGTRRTSDDMDGYFGHKGELPGSYYSTLSFSTKLSTEKVNNKPLIDAILQACGFAVVVDVPNDKATYNPIQEALKSMRFNLHLSGHRHEVVGSRGTLTIAGEMDGNTTISANMQGFRGTAPSDEALPTVARPSTCYEVMTQANTSLTVFGTALPLVSYSLDVGGVIVRSHTSETDEFILTDRMPVLNLTTLKPLVGTFNYHTKEDSPCDTGAVSLVTSGMEFDAATASMGKVTEGDNNGAATISFPLYLQRDQGNDDFTLTF